MNEWRIYSFMKMSWLEEGRIPTRKEIIAEFSEASMYEVQEGMIEFQIAYDRTWSKIEPLKRGKEAHA